MFGLDPTIVTFTIYIFGMIGIGVAGRRVFIRFGRGLDCHWFDLGSLFKLALRCRTFTGLHRIQS